MFFLLLGMFTAFGLLLLGLPVCLLAPSSCCECSFWWWPAKQSHRRVPSATFVTSRAVPVEDLMEDEAEVTTLAERWVCAVEGFSLVTNCPCVCVNGGREGTKLSGCPWRSGRG